MIYWMSLQQEKVKKKLNHYMKKKKQFQLRKKKIAIIKKIRRSKSLEQQLNFNYR